MPLQGASPRRHSPPPEQEAPKASQGLQVSGVPHEVCDTIATGYKVAICSRGNLLYMRIYLISNNRPKVTLEKRIWALIYLLYK